MRNASRLGLLACFFGGKGDGWEGKSMEHFDKDLLGIGLKGEFILDSDVYILF